MKRLCALSICCSMLFLTTGCSVFMSTPRVAHVKITGLNNQLSEYVINLDDLTESDMDIPLNDHYAIRLDLELMCSDQDLMNSDSRLTREEPGAQFSPWVMYKFRF